YGAKNSGDRRLVDQQLRFRLQRTSYLNPVIKNHFRPRISQQVALSERNTQFLEGFVIGMALDSFRDQERIALFSQLEQQADDGLLGHVQRHMLDDPIADLDEIGQELHDGIQVTVTASHIIECDFETEFTQAINVAAQQIHVANRMPFGQFNDDVAGVNFANGFDQRQAKEIIGLK